MCQVIAMYDYTAANQDELNFTKGQLISILDKTNPDWWKGEVGGVTGLLPTNYVKMTTESDPSQQCEYKLSSVVLSSWNRQEVTCIPGLGTNFLSCSDWFRCARL